MGQWGHVGRWLHRFGVLSKELPLAPTFPPQSNENVRLKCYPKVCEGYVVFTTRKTGRGHTLARTPLPLTEKSFSRSTYRGSHASTVYVPVVCGGWCGGVDGVCSEVSHDRRQMTEHKQ